MAVYRLHRKEWEKGFKSHGDQKQGEESKKGQSTAEGEMDSEKKQNQQATATVTLSPKTKSTSKVEPGKAALPVTHKTKVKSNLNSPTLTFPGGGRKGISSGLGAIVRRDVPGKGLESRRGSRAQGEASSKSEWWKVLPSNGKAPKGSISIGTHK